LREEPALNLPFVVVADYYLESSLKYPNKQAANGFIK